MKELYQRNIAKLEEELEQKDKLLKIINYIVCATVWIRWCIITLYLLYDIVKKWINNIDYIEFLSRFVFYTPVLYLTYNKNRIASLSLLCINIYACFWLLVNILVHENIGGSLFNISTLIISYLWTFIYFYHLFLNKKAKSFKIDIVMWVLLIISTILTIIWILDLAWGILVFLLLFITFLCVVWCFKYHSITWKKKLSIFGILTIIFLIIFTIFSLIWILVEYWILS